MARVLSIFLVLLLYPIFVTADPWPQGFPYNLPEETDTIEFVDVTPRHDWASSAIYYLSSIEVIHGDGNGLFMPDEFVTREQLAKIIALFYELPQEAPFEDTFQDVDSSMWSYDYIEASHSCLTGFKGRGNQKPFFRPLDYAVREDVFVAVVKAMGLADLKGRNKNILEQSFLDAHLVTYELRPFVSIALERGLVLGYDEYLRPQGFITRAELVVLLYRTLKTIAP